MFGEDALSELKKMPLSDCTTTKRIQDMLGNNKCKIKTKILKHELFALQVDESTNITGKILNDNGKNVDHLDHVIYAEALAQQIYSIKPPITVGIFSMWGSGKSFLLKHVQSLLTLKQRQDNNLKSSKNRTDKWVYLCNIIFSIILILLIITFSALVILYNSGIHLSTTSTVFLILLLVLLMSLYLIVQTSGKNWFAGGSFRYGWTLVYALFTILPIKDAESTVVRVTSHNKVRLEAIKRSSKVKEICYDKEIENLKQPSKQKKRQRYIFVNFNAWEYAGSDVLWAGIVTNLADKVEHEFGTLTSRIFRTINLAATARFQPKIYSKNTQLFVKIPSSAYKNNIEITTAMTAYGVVKSCQKLIDQKDKKKLKKAHSFLSEDEEKWWVVTFEEQSEAVNACVSLQQRGVNTKLNILIRNSLDKYKNSFCGRLQKFLDYFKAQPKLTCKVATLYWFLLFIFAASITPIISSLIAFYLNFYEGEIPSTTIIFVQVFSWLPAVGGLAYVVISTIWANLHSQQNRVYKALKGIKKNLADELGFMHKVKREVEAITDLVHAVEFIYNIRYKVVIMIDDLDRIPLPEVKRLLESVNILLSERNSPFVCLIAVDSRIAVKCFEEPADSGYISNINGYEYLKKIINLPFCIPEMDSDNKSRYIAGLIDEADYTEDKFKQDTSKVKTNKPDQQNPGAKYNSKTSHNEHDQRSGQLESRCKMERCNDAEIDGIERIPQIEKDRQKTLIEENETFGCRFLMSQDRSVKTQTRYKTTSPLNLLGPCIDFNRFLFTCRNFMFENEFVRKHLQGNPRNIKRIFNLISISTSVIRYHQEREKREEFIRNISETSYHNQDSNADSIVKGNKSIVHNDKVEQERQYGLLAEDIVLWIILTDQWPFRVSYILQAMQDADQRSDAGRKEEGIDDEKSLLYIYKKIRPEISSSGIDDHHFRLDGDTDVLYSLLKLLEVENRLSKGRVKSFLKYSVNLDHSIRKTILHERNRRDLTVKFESIQENNFIN